MIEYHIKEHLKEVMKEWADSADDDIESLIRKNCFIAGGAIASMSHDEDPSDYDVYVDDKEALKELAGYYVDRYNDINNTEFTMTENNGCGMKFVSEHSTFVAETGENRDEEYVPIAVTENAITLTHSKKPSIQLVVRFCGDPDEVVERFDFAHTKNYFYQGRIHWDKDALKALLGKDLIYTGSEFPICALIRTRKFIKRGYAIGAPSFLKIAMQVSETDMSDPKVFREQLTGVDVFYFDEIMNKLDDDEISTITYEVIDEIVNLVSEGVDDA